MRKRIKFSGHDCRGTRRWVKPPRAVQRLAYGAADKMEKITSIRPNVAILPPHRVKSEKAMGKL